MKQFHSHLPFLKRCQHTRCKKRFKSLIKTAGSGDILTLSECAKNLLLGNIPMTQNQKNKLKKYKNKIKILALKKNSISKKRRMLQRGGGAFIPLLASLAGSLLSSIVQ